MAPQNFPHIETELIDGVGWIWLNRPQKRNAMSADMWTDLPLAVHQLGQRKETRVIVVGGREGCFTVGIDLELLSQPIPTGPSQGAENLALYQQLKAFQAAFSSFTEVSQPVIAAVEGYCLGAGMDLITACDIRLASQDATFSIRETRMGLVADMGTLQRLPRIIGPGHVAELAYTGKDIGAERAAEIGLVERVYPSGEELRRGAEEMAREIAANSPLVVAGVKRILQAGAGQSLEQSLDYVILWNAAMLQTHDLKEASQAFRERRPPEFTGT